MVSGSVGSVTFYVRGGEQIMAARIEKAKDPRTPAQIIQRIKFPNIVAMYRSFRGLLDECFEQQRRKGRKSLVPIYNRFIGANLFSLPVYLTRTESATGYCIAAPYRISEGSLPAILTRGTGADTLTNISLGNLQLTSATTVAQFSLAVVRNNPLYLLGDTLLYLSALQSADPSTGIPGVSVSLYKVTLDAADHTPLHLVAPSFGFSSAHGCLSHGEDIGPGAFAWVHTRYTPEGLQDSTQRLVLHNPLFSLCNSDTALQRALRSYGARPVPIAPDASSPVQFP